MGWDGAGGYTRIHNFSADASSGINILAARMDAEIDDMASAFTRVWTRDGQNVPTQDLPMGGRKFVNVGAPTSVSNFMRVREFVENVPIFMQDVESSADRISVSSQYFTSVSANQAPVDGTKIMVRVNSNKSSAVLYLDGHSANVEFQDGNRAANAMVSGGIYELTYSSVDTAWKLPTPDDGRTAAEISAGVTPTNYQYPPGHLYRYGTNTTPGTTDMAAALQAAIDQAAKSGGTGVVQIPAGLIAVQSGFTLTSAVLIKGVSGPPGGTGNNTKPFSVILKQFDGDLFTFDGANGSGGVQGSGGGVEDLRLVSDTGTAITANGGGNAIVITGTTVNERASWVKVRNVVIEYAASRDSWTWAIVVDGTAITGSIVPDLWFADITTHTASSNGGAMRLLAANAKVYDCAFYDAHGHVEVSGISGTPSSSVLFDNVDVSGNVSLDYATNVSWLGGIISGTLSNTANTTGQCFFMPTRMGTAFTSANNNAGAAFILIRYSTSAYAAVSGGLRMTQALILENAQHLHGLTAAGTNAPSLIGMNASDEVVIAANGSDIRWGTALVALGGGSAPTLGTIGGGGPATAGQNSWMRVIDSAGNAFWVPVWK